jgi:hypothetical protein
MSLVKFIEFLRNHLRTVVRICYAVLGLLILLDLLLVNKEEAHTPVEHLPAFWSVFGFVACVAIILLSKWFGHAGIMKKENYYDEPDSGGEQ